MSLFHVNFHLINFNYFCLYFKNDWRLYIHILYFFFIRIIIQRSNECIQLLHFKTFLFSFKTLNRYISAALIMGKEFTIWLVFQLFATFGFVKEIVAMTQNDLLPWCSQQRIETFLSWTSCIAKNVWVFHTIICSLYGEWKEVLTGYSNVWFFSP